MILVIAAWALMVYAHGLPPLLASHDAALMNGFYGWQGEIQTPMFLRMVLKSPFEGFDASAGVSPRAMHVVYSITFVVSFLLLVFAPVLTMRLRAEKVVRGIRAGGIVMFVPAALTLLPASFGFPEPRMGLHLVLTALCVGGISLLLPYSSGDEAMIEREDER